MGWFNYYGLMIMAIIMIPNIVYAVKHKNDVAPFYNKKAVVVTEQIGRYGCFALMIFNIPYTYFDFWFANAPIVYLAVNGALCLTYYIFWVVARNDNGLLKALSLSILPTVVFLFSGVVLANIPLIVFAVIFGIAHIFISCKNAVVPSRRKKPTYEEKYRNEAIALFVFILVAFVAIGIVFGADIGNGAFPL